MLSVARYLIQIQYFFWQLVNIISRDFLFSTQSWENKTILTIKTRLNYEVNAHLNLDSEPVVKGKIMCKIDCPCS